MGDIVTFSPAVSRQTQTPSQSGVFDLGEPNLEYRAAYISDKVRITEEDPTALYATWGEGGFHLVGRNDGGNQFNGYGIISAYDGNEPFLLVTRTNSADLSATVPVALGENLFTISPTGSDGTDYFGSGAGLYFTVDDVVSAGDVPFKIALNTGKGIYAYNVELALRSSGILEFDSFTTLNTPEKRSRQFVTSDLTSNATPSTNTFFVLEDETNYHFRVAVKGRFRDVTVDKGVVGFLEFAVYRNNGGSAVLAPFPFKGIQETGVASGYDFQPIVSGNNVIIELTGAAGEVVDWSTDTIWSGAGN